MKLFFFILSLVLIAGCKTAPPTTLMNSVTDNTITKREFRDTLIRIPANGVLVNKNLPADCPQVDFDTTAKKGNVSVNVKIKNNHLSVDCKADSLEKVIRGLIETRSQTQTITKEIPVQVLVDNPYIPKWIWYLVGVLAALAAWGNRKFLIGIIKLIKFA